VGLLLVTKVLPHGSEQAVRDVLGAVGWTFLRRLLLPLSRQASPSADAEALQKQQLSCTLAIAILSAACRLPECAGSDELLELAPLLAKVVLAGGVARHMLASLPEQASAAAAGLDLAADEAAVADALDCLRAVAGSGSYGARVVAESKGFAAAAAGLAASAVAAAARGQGDQGAMTMALSAMQLLGLTLTSAHGRRHQLVAGGARALGPSASPAPH
jgi:hypothetical protein